MNFRTLILIAALAMVISGETRALGSSFIINLDQVGPDVVGTGSGTIDTAALSFNGPGNYSPFLGPAYGGIYLGPMNSDFDGYTGITGPSSIGPNTNYSYATTGSGDFAGTDDESIIVPSGYVSGAPLLDTATWQNQTFGTLGVTPGTYTWTWNSGADSFTLVAVPEPSQYGVFIFLATLGFIIWRRAPARLASAVSKPS